MSTNRPPGTVRQADPSEDDIVECLAALKRNLDRLREAPDPTGTIAELRKVVRDIELELSLR